MSEYLSDIISLNSVCKDPNFIKLKVPKGTKFRVKNEGDWDVKIWCFLDTKDGAICVYRVNNTLSKVLFAFYFTFTFIGSIINQGFTKIKNVILSNYYPSKFSTQKPVDIIRPVGQDLELYRTIMKFNNLEEYLI